ncbi:type III secretion system export apparatus subunit SctV [Chitinivorax sp. B]|uniref:type III secretion system export apparatus subunit SctV n=1 Tax=Chitinivorax sp. B TaxID=2502235 RepID=UPI0010F97A58|nr:type III secretion system export apparatus subunit SctV [Chitinivorax sp. B]
MNQIQSRLMALARLAAARSEVVAVGVVISIVFMLVLPLPIWLVDMLIALNICISCLLVVIALYVPGPLAFSTFPAVLLVTTLFRLALEVSTSRLILLEADAGHIVEAFGQFVVGGNLVVGMVIFLILTVVQFLVITKGSERVAEVSARFTLDAMPGKQMSIDSDLRAGLLDAAQARAKREDLGKESQLFGAMDGAMKFVKGDAIAGLMVVAVNLIGGISIGVLQRGMPAGEAMRTYSVLTIGDGLIAQIPALLISLCAGLIITRVSSGDSTTENVGQEIARQLFAEPRALIIAAGVMVIFALVPGMPSLVFLILAALSAGAGYYKLRHAKRDGAEVSQGPYLVPEANAFSAVRPLWLACSLDSYADPRMYRLIDELRLRQNVLIEDYGMVVPSLEYEPDTTLAPASLRFAVHEIPVLYLVLRWDALWVRRSAVELQALGCEPEAEEADGCWVAYTQADALSTAGVSFQLFIHAAADRIDLAMQRHLSSFIGMQETQRYLSWLEFKHPELVKESTRVLPLGRITDIFQRLAADVVSIRNMRLIMETLIDWGQRERDVGLLTDFVRIALRNQLSHEYAPNGQLQAILLEQETETQLRDTIRQTVHGVFFALTPAQTQALLEQIQRIRLATRDSQERVVLLVAQDLRRCLRKLIEEQFFDLPVLSFSEISNSVTVQPLCRL